MAPEHTWLSPQPGARGARGRRRPHSPLALSSLCFPHKLAFRAALACASQPCPYCTPAASLPPTGFALAPPLRRSSAVPLLPLCARARARAQVSRLAVVVNSRASHLCTGLPPFVVVGKGGRRPAPSLVYTRPSVSFARLVHPYARLFTQSDAADALQYLHLACVDADLPARCGDEQVARTHERVRELLLEDEPAQRAAARWEEGQDQGGASGGSPPSPSSCTALPSSTTPSPPSSTASSTVAVPFRQRARISMT